ncbi:SWIM zinc finger family protein [Cohnella cholangitidis]|uniref:SWIM-type domain-containing protein n=1 Tax=Cohnella cholangitidis TaxID=2598458 RepID=A0A7G5C0L5_9BACL|nr:SWIM zinc finger family protein [Cohnella cholangitidis]QMV42749.1 hypothetical protein FPL14_17305 [Cohnella cholangitidis]
MIPTYELDDDQWNRLVQDVADHFGDVTLSRGFQYYKQGCVVKLTLPSQRTIKAVVEGSEYYQVEIDLDSLSASRCNCPVGRNCKHMFAAILKYANLHNRSIHTLVNAKTTALAKPRDDNASSAKSYNQAKQLAAKKAAESYAQLQQQAQRIPHLSISEWHAWFELASERTLQGSRNTQFVTDSLAAIFRYKPSLPSEIELFFILHAHMFVLSRLTKKPQDQSGYVYSYLAFHAHHAASDLQTTIEQGIIQLSPAAADPANARMVQQSLSYVRKEMLAESNENHYFLAHYLSIWSRWAVPAIRESNLYEMELRSLDENANELGSSLSPFAWKVAQAGIRLYESKDSEAWMLLHDAKKTSEIPGEYLLSFLAYLSRTEQWNRLTAWLREIAPLLNLRREASIRPYSEYWEQAVRYLPETEQQMWDALVSMLPHSRALYEEKLLSNGKWERWMDFHLSMDSDPLDFRATDLQPLEKNAPEVLIPFYHQAVERYVLVKNRDSYKAATKLLKRLAKLYKKIKQEPRWEQFLSSFIVRHSRLRALQEELRKGNLLP